MLDEAAWLECGDPDVLFRNRYKMIPRRNRKLKLFACGCCRQIWNFIADPICRTAVEVAERDGDLACTDAEYIAADAAVEELWARFEVERPQTLEQTIAYACLMAIGSARETARPVVQALTMIEHGISTYEQNLEPIVQGEAYALTVKKYERFLADLFRDEFGNPFRPITLDRTAISAAAVELAAEMYDRGDFSAMQELGAALLACGTCDPEILAHCESPGPHVKGCWVVDLVLGFEKSTPR